MSFDLKRFDEEALQSISLAPNLALRLGYYNIGSAMLLLGIVCYGHANNITRIILSQQNVREEILANTIQQVIGRGMRNFARPGNVPFNRDGEKILGDAIRMSDWKGVYYATNAQIVLAILGDKNCEAYKVLEFMRINLSLLKSKLEKLNTTGGSSEQLKRPNSPDRGGELAMAGAVADQEGVDLKGVKDFCEDLTDLAAQGRLDPLACRDKELERVIQILSRRTKNNPVLIGEPGVGKTAIADGLAQRIVFGDVPPQLAGCRVIRVDVAGTISGTKFRGEFETRIKELLKMAKENKKLIFFIDEIHTMVGAGNGGDGPDAANMMKGALARGQMRCLGATTLDEYRKHFEKDKALQRRFQPVMVEEPTPEDCLEILKTLRPRYERFHKVEITDEALSAAVSLSHRYITDRFLPDKAIDLLDEAGSRVRASSKNKVITFEKPVAQGQRTKLEADLAEAIREQNYARAANIQKELGSTAYSFKVTAGDIADIVNSWTGIPVSRLTRDENRKLLGMESAIHGRLIGQEDAVNAVCRAIRRSRSGVRTARRPIASFIFVGPTGVGKTELVKALAQFLFDDEESIIRLDMSEYMESHTVSKMIGAPPGFVGYDEGGRLTEAVRRKPYSLVLFDEVEKAHPDVFNLLLQVLEDGRLTDSKGRTVDFRNTLLVMTSNLGTGKSGGGLGFQFGDEEDNEYRADVQKATTALKQYFRPEFLNRLDEVIVFRKPSKDHLKAIAKVLLRGLESRLADKGMALLVEDQALDLLVKEGYSPEHGARELRRVIVRRLEDALSEMILKGELTEGATIRVSLGAPGELRFGFGFEASAAATSQPALA
ncbi:AAA domain-containing protein [bacterium]|nr:AAA domain-containing protein [bacterium]